jgi:hypothetical protein
VCRFGVALLLCFCSALGGCGGQHLPDRYITKGHLTCSSEHPPVDVHVLIGRPLEDARGVVKGQDCLLRIRFRDGVWQGGNTINLLSPLLDVAVADGKVVGVAPDPDR